jgi:hypothetical protein
MKRLILLFALVAISLTSFGQNTEAQNLTIINLVRNSTLSPAKVANALDALNYSKQGILQAYTASGTDTYTVTGPTAITSYASGQIVIVTFTNANTGAATLNINGTGAVDLKDSQGNALTAGAIPAGSTSIWKHNGTNFRQVGSSGGGGGPGTPGGSDTQVQYNDGGSFNGEPDMAYNESTNTLTVDNVAVDTEAYDASGWNGDLTVPTKDAVRDKIETLPKVYSFAFSDESTAITSGTGKLTFSMPYAMTVTNIYCALKTAQASGSIFTIDINEAGTTILSTKITIDNTETDSYTGTPPVISDGSLAFRSVITVDVDQVGNGTAVGGKCDIIGY